MDADEFWRLIDLLGPEGAGGRFDDLDAALMAGGQSQIEEFDEHLWSAVRQLQTMEHRARGILDVDDPLGASPIPQSDDVAEDAAFAVISIGRSVFDRVRDNPSHLDVRWPLADAYRLRFTPARAFERLTGNPWVSMSSQAGDQSQVSRSPHLPWLFLSVDFETLKGAKGVDWAWVRTHRKPYQAKINWLLLQIAPFAPPDGPPRAVPHTAWTAWWDTDSHLASELQVFFDFEPHSRERHNIRSRGTSAKRQVRANFVFDLQSIDGSDEEIAATARRHLGDALTAIAHKLKMPEPPALPLTRRERAARD